MYTGQPVSAARSVEKLVGDASQGIPEEDPEDNDLSLKQRTMVISCLSKCRMKRAGLPATTL